MPDKKDPGLIAPFLACPKLGPPPRGDGHMDQQTIEFLKALRMAVKDGYYTEADYKHVHNVVSNLAAINAECRKDIDRRLNKLEKQLGIKMSK